MPAFQQQAKAIGIQLNTTCYTAQPDFFTNLLPTGKFDLAEYAFTGGPDPSGWDAIYQCVNATKNLGGQNYKNYCNHKVDTLLQEGRQRAQPDEADGGLRGRCEDRVEHVAIIPLYARPSFLFYNSAIKRHEPVGQPDVGEGPLWNAQSWKWSS